MLGILEMKQLINMQKQFPKECIQTDNNYKKQSEKNKFT